MKTATVAMKAAIAAQVMKPATCWLCQLRDGTVLAFTDHDRDLVFDLESFITAAPFSYGTIPGIAGTGSQTYLSTAGYDATDVENTAALNVDNMEVHGILSSPSITEDDLRAGRWDFANVVVFVVDWGNLAAGPIIERCGKLGQVTVDGGQFRAELRGLAQYLTRTFGWLTSPMCRYDLGDSFCTVNLAGGNTSGDFTVTSFIEGISDDGLVIFDSARTEPGPSGGIVILDITNADPGVVQLASDVPFVEGQPITMYGIVGPALLNGTTVARNVSGDTFELGVDTSDTAVYPAYVGGGSVIALGATSGYFDGGVLTITSGANAGLSREVKSYVEGQITLHLPFPYPMEFATAGGPTYTMTVGCDKSRETCKTRFNNLDNFGGEDFLPGIDKIVQVGRHDG